ncbi:MAG: HD domain-containing protein [Acidobacteria bacterium]|nr:HD domain-containing protein [Acidobacteriota bacterium]
MDVRSITRYLKRQLKPAGAQWFVVYERLLGSTLFYPLFDLHLARHAPDPDFAVVDDVFLRRLTTTGRIRKSVSTHHSAATGQTIVFYSPDFVHSALQQDYRIVFGTSNRDRSLQPQQIRPLLPRLESCLLPLIRNTHSRFRRICRPWVQEIRQAYFKDLSYRDALTRALELVAGVCGSCAGRILLRSNMSHTTTYVSADQDRSIDSEQVHRIFRVLLDNGGPVRIPESVLARQDLPGFRGLFFHLEDENFSAAILLLFDSQANGHGDIFGILREMVLQVSHFLAETSPLNAKLRDSFINRDLQNAVMGLLPLLERDEFIHSLPCMIREYLRVGYVAFYLPESEGFNWRRHQHDGEIQPTSTGQLREAHSNCLLMQCVHSGKTILKTVLSGKEKSQVLDSPSIASVLYYPLQEKGEVVALLKIADHTPSAITFAHLHRLRMLEPYLITALENISRYHILLQMVFRDSETGLLNRRGFEEQIARQLDVGKTRGRHFAIMFIGLDRSESHFHSPSLMSRRRLLLAHSQWLQVKLPPTTIIGFDGESTFQALITEMDLNEALKLARNICWERKMLHAEENETVTYSIGVSSFPLNGTNVEALSLAAEQALMISRYQGGDTASIMGSEILKKLSLEILSGLLGRRTFKTGPELLDGVMEKISIRDQDQNGLTVFEVINSLVTAVDAKDHYTGNHSSESSIFSVALAKRLGLDEQAVERLRIASKLHDVGKIGIPEYILCKQEKLSIDEMEVMKRHSEIGARIIRPISSLRHIADIIEHHHERWDGTGYPNNLRGEEIPLESRILAVVDAFHAMISDRPYRNAMSRETALEEIAREAGHQFDPYISRQFVDLMHERKTAL